LCEALPIEILSHDTVEAKLLHPCVAYEVVLFEDVARNPISGLAQSTRWMLGEVRNACYLDGPYKFFVNSSAMIYSRVRTGKKKTFSWTRWTDVPCGLGAEYLSHIGFRGYHAGPSILLLNIFGMVLVECNLGLQLEGHRSGSWSTNVLFFVVITLFILPNAFMVLGYIPSLNYGEALRQQRARRGQTRDAPLSLDVGGPSTFDRRVSFTPQANEEAISGGCRCGRLVLLILLDIFFSVVLYAPEQVEGWLRLLRGIWSQITGQQNWVPQEQVEKEVERELSLRYAFGKTWQVALVGAASWVFMIWRAAVGSPCWNPFWVVMTNIWLLHPVTTYWLCTQFPESRKTSWLWLWVMELRESQNRQYEL
jgi:hypothetical protein